MLRCSAVQKGLSADTEALLKHLVSSTNTITQRVCPKWLPSSPCPIMGCRVTLTRPTLLRLHFPRLTSRFSPDHTFPPCNARCIRKAPSESPSSAATGGAVRRGCLSGRSPRVPRWPPVVSSAGESSVQARLEQTTGSAGSPSLPTFLAKQESRPPAGAGPGQRNAKQWKAVRPHPRTESIHTPQSPPFLVRPPPRRRVLVRKSSLPAG